MVTRYAIAAVFWSLMAGATYGQTGERAMLPQQAQLPMPPMPDGVEPPEPPAAKPRPPRRSATTEPTQSAYKRNVMQQLQVHNSFQSDQAFGELPELNQRMPAFRVSTEVAPVQDMSLLSLDELERYIKQLDLNTYAGALTVDEHYAGDAFASSLPGMTRKIQDQILKGPSVNPEVPPEFAPKPRAARSGERHQRTAQPEPERLDPLPPSSDMANLRSPQYGAPRSRYAEDGIPDALLQTPEEFILDLTPDITEGSELDPQSAELLNRITAGSLETEPQAIEITMGKAIDIERGERQNPFEISVTDEPLYEDGVMEEPLLATTLEMGDMPDTLPPMEVMNSAYDAYAVGQYESAVMFYRKLIQENPDNIAALFGLATAYQRGGQFEQAKEVYIDLLNREEDHLPALNNFLILLGGENPEVAIRQLKKLSKINPEYAAIPAQLASLYIEQEDYENAAKYMSRAAILEPKNLRYRYYLAVMMAELGHVETAAKLYQYMLKMYRQHGATLPVDMAVLQEEMTKLGRSPN